LVAVWLAVRLPDAGSKNSLWNLNFPTGNSVRRNGTIRFSLSTSGVFQRNRITGRDRAISWPLLPFELPFSQLNISCNGRDVLLRVRGCACKERECAHENAGIRDKGLRGACSRATPVARERNPTTCNCSQALTLKPCVRWWSRSRISPRLVTYHLAPNPKKQC
jgi:hypothetical protein